VRESESHLFNRPPFDAVNADLYGGNQVPRLAHREGLGGPTSFPATAAHGIAHASNTRHAGPSPTLPTVLSMSAPIACRRGGAFRRGGARSSRATKKASDRPTSTGVPSRAHHGGYTNKRGEINVSEIYPHVKDARSPARPTHAQVGPSMSFLLTTSSGFECSSNRFGRVINTCFQGRLSERGTGHLFRNQHGLTRNSDPSLPFHQPYLLQPAAPSYPPAGCKLDPSSFPVLRRAPGDAGTLCIAGGSATGSLPCRTDERSNALFVGIGNPPSCPPSLLLCLIMWRSALS
jgi:hypothetical protein